MVAERYRGKDFLLKMMDKERPDIAKRYHMQWYVKDDRECGKNLHQGELNFRCVDKDKNKHMTALLKKIKKQYKLPTIEIIYFSTRRI